MYIGALALSLSLSLPCYSYIHNDGPLYISNFVLIVFYNHISFIFGLAPPKCSLLLCVYFVCCFVHFHNAVVELHWKWAPSKQPVFFFSISLLPPSLYHLYLPSMVTLSFSISISLQLLAVTRADGRWANPTATIQSQAKMLNVFRSIIWRRRCDDDFILDFIVHLLSRPCKTTFRVGSLRKSLKAFSSLIQLTIHAYGNTNACMHTIHTHSFTHSHYNNNNQQTNRKYMYRKNE